MANKRPFATLNRPSDFAHLKQRGQRARPCSWMILSYSPNQSENLRCGWTISKKVGNAVIRNRLKRWCRHFFRQAGAPTSLGLDVNVILLQQPPDFYRQIEQGEFTRALEQGWKLVLKRSQTRSSSSRDRLS